MVEFPSNLPRLLDDNWRHVKKPVKAANNPGNPPPEVQATTHKAPVEKTLPEDSATVSPVVIEEINLSGISPEDAQKLQTIIAFQEWGEPSLGKIPDGLKKLQGELGNVTSGITVVVGGQTFQKQANPLEQAGQWISDSISEIRKRKKSDDKTSLLTDGELNSLFEPLVAEARIIDAKLQRSRESTTYNLRR